MAYLIEQILVYLLIAFVIGAVVGWLICSQGMKRRIAALEKDLA